MATQEKPPDALDVVRKSALSRVSRIDEVPETYGRLLEEYAQLLKTLDFNPYMSLVWILLLSFNPRWQYRFWTSPQVRAFVKVSDAVRQDLPCAANILKRVQALDDAQLRALARCSALNVVKLTNRILYGGLNKVFVALAALLAIAKGLKEAFGLDLGGYVLPAVPMLVGPLVGLVAGVVFNLLMWYQRLRLVRALDDIISIAVAAGNLKL